MAVEKKKEQKAFEIFAKQAGELINDSSSMLNFDTYDFPKTPAGDEARMAWEAFTEEWDNHVDELIILMKGLKDERRLKPKGGASWLS